MPRRTKKQVKRRQNKKRKTQKGGSSPSVKSLTDLFTSLTTPSGPEPEIKTIEELTMETKAPEISDREQSWKWPLFQLPQFYNNNYNQILIQFKNDDFNHQKANFNRAPSSSEVSGSYYFDIPRNKTAEQDYTYYDRYKLDFHIINNLLNFDKEYKNKALYQINNFKDTYIMNQSKINDFNSNKFNILTKIDEAKYNYLYINKYDLITLLKLYNVYQPSELQNLGILNEMMKFTRLENLYYLFEKIYTKMNINSGKETFNKFFGFFIDKEIEVINNLNVVKINYLYNYNQSLSYTFKNQGYKKQEAKIVFPKFNQNSQLWINNEVYENVYEYVRNYHIDNLPFYIKNIEYPNENSDKLVVIQRKLVSSSVSESKDNEMVFKEPKQFIAIMNHCERFLEGAFQSLNMENVPEAYKTSVGDDNQVFLNIKNIKNDISKYFNDIATLIQEYVNYETNNYIFNEDKQLKEFKNNYNFKLNIIKKDNLGIALKKVSDTIYNDIFSEISINNKTFKISKYTNEAIPFDNKYFIYSDDADDLVVYSNLNISSSINNKEFISMIVLRILQTIIEAIKNKELDKYSVLAYSVL